MLRDIKPYKQGTLSRWCSVYSVINAVRMLGLELPVNKAQEMYDYVLDQLYVYDALDEIKSYQKKKKETVALIFDAVDRAQRSFKDTTILDDLRKQKVIELHF